MWQKWILLIKNLEEICKGNKKDYKRQEKALWDHLFVEVKESTGLINPLFIIYAFNWFRKVIQLMIDNRKGKTSKLNSILEGLNPYRCTIPVLVKKIKKMNGGCNSAWNEVKDEVLITLDYLGGVVKKMEEKLDLYGLKDADAPKQDISMKKIAQMAKKKSMTELTGEDKYEGEKLEEYVYRVKKPRDYAKTIDPELLMPECILKDNAAPS